MQSMCKKQYCKTRKGYEEKLQIRSNLPKERHSGETVILGQIGMVQGKVFLSQPSASQCLGGYEVLGVGLLT